MLTGIELLDKLRVVQWNTAVETYGNNHATLIGLLINWWINLAPGVHHVVESGPNFGKYANGKGSGKCDAIFCENNDALGVLEVEGTRTIETITKVGKFFTSKQPDLQSLNFAIILFYATQPQGRGRNRQVTPVWEQNISQTVSTVSSQNATKPLIVITLDKIYERYVEGIRQRNDYYKCTVSSINGRVYLNGKNIGEGSFYYGPKH